MTPFQRAEAKLNPKSPLFEEQKRLAEASEIYLNDIYQVMVRRNVHVGEGFPEMDWLSIKRIDKQPIGLEHFRDFQQIKNMLCGPENEGVELYPAESRLVDAANQYHLYVLRNKNIRFPFGFTDRLVGDEEAAAQVGAVQRPF